MKRLRRILVALAFEAFAVPALGQSQDVTVLKGQSDQTYKRLVEADRNLTTGKSAEAADALQRILDEAGDDLVSADGKHFRTARRVAQRVLAKLPPDALKAYRDRADEPARLLLEAGRKNRDPRPLRQLIDRYFASRPAEEALLLLGELTFERGDFRTAESVWRRLLVDSPNDLDPPFPDPKADPTAVRSRVALALIFQGELEAARAELKKVAANPKATGRLAGVDGPFAETLQKLLERPPVLSADATGDGEWTGFGGSSSRSGAVSGRLPYYWPSRPTWQVPIPRDDNQIRTSNLPRVAPTKSVAFHPVVLDGIAYLADSTRVFGFDPLTGKNVFNFDLRSQVAGNRFRSQKTQLPINYDADFTLAAGDGLLVARLGSPKMTELGPDPTGRPGQSPSVLVGFRKGANNGPLEAKWTLLPPGPAPEFAAWEGVPILADGRIYAPFARLGNRVKHAVACYEDPPGNPVWIAELAESPSIADRTRHELLTLAGSNLVFCTHTGAVVAINAQTGKPAWAMKYPHVERTAANPPQRDLSPPLYDGGRIFVAPSDADFLYALDSETGRPLWQSGPIQVDQMLGVTHGRLVCSIAGPTRGIRGYNIRDGNYLDPAGWAVHDDPLLASFGRGLVSNDLILWPTKTDLFLLNPETGMPLRPPIRGPHGNLAYANGVVLVATPTELWGYVADRVQLQERKVEVAQRPNNAEVKRLFAIALADAGKWDEAKAAIANDPDAARFKAEWNSDRAERALAAGRVDDARTIWDAVIKGDDPAAWKARAAFRWFGSYHPNLLFDTGRYDGDRVPEVVKTIDLPKEAFRESVLVYGGIERWPYRLPNEVRYPPNASDFAPAPNAFAESRGFDPDILHGLGVGTTVETVRIGPNNFQPLANLGQRPGLPGFSRGPFPTSVLLSDGRELRLFSITESRILWSIQLPNGFVPTEALGGVLAGLRGFMNVDLANGKVTNHALLPESDPITSHRGLPYPRSLEAKDRSASLANFAFRDSSFIADLGPYHRLYTAVGNGSRMRIADGSGYPPYRPFPLGSPKPFAQSSAGDDAKALTRLGELGYQIPAEASLSGQPPIVLNLSKGVLVGVRRNFGVELTLLSHTRRTVIWGSRTAVLPVENFDPKRVDFDDANLYVPTEGRLYTIRLNDGAIVWTADLGADTEWQVWAGRKTIAVHAVRPVVRDPLTHVLNRMGRALWERPNPARISALLFALYDSWANRTLPIRFLDPGTGREVHRLDLDVGPVAVVQFGPERSVVVTGDRIYRLQSP